MKQSKLCNGCKQYIRERLFSSGAKEQTFPIHLPLEIILLLISLTNILPLYYFERYVGDVDIREQLTTKATNSTKNQTYATVLQHVA